MRRPGFPRRASLALAAAAAFACVTDTRIGPEIIASITVVPASGDVAVGATLQLTAVARDSNGVPYLGIPAVWSSSNDAVATVSDAGFVTGVALGPVMITAEIDGLTSMAMLNTVPPPAIALSAGTAIFNGFANGPDPAPQTITVTNGGGATLSGLSLGSVVYGAGASGWLTGGLDIGTAPATLTLNASPSGLAVGSYTATLPITAVVAGNSPESVTVTLNVTVDAASQMALDTGDAQTAAVNTTVPVSPAVIVRDQYGNPVPNVAVIYAVTGGGGTITGDTATSNANGVATVGSWTMGTVVGPNTLEATAPGLAGSPVGFAATAVAGAASAIALSTGDGQSATVGAPVSVAPVVFVTDQFGNAVAGVAVTFAVGSGGGSVTGGNATTDANGLAAVTMWTLGTTSGPNTLTATATGLSGSPVTFTAMGLPAPASQVAASAGDGQSAPVNSAVPTPPTVLVTDPFGNPVPGVDVTFAVGSGGGNVTGSLVTTGANGLAAVGSWTLGTNTGANTLTATAPGLSGSPVTFTATAIAGAATQIALSAGDGQSATVNTAVATDPAVLVRDAFNNPVAGVAVAFTVTGGGGAVVGGAATTDTSGIATVTSWTLGTTAGANTLSAAAAGLTGSPVSFTATGTADVATQIALNAGNNQTATVNTAVAVAPAVLVRDQFNNPVAGTAVAFAVTGGGGSLVGGGATTNASGIASVTSWTLGTTAGTNNNTLTATAAGLAGSPVPFTASATAGPATQIALSAGDNQSAAVNTAVPIAPAVLVRDQFNNAVANVPVTFAVTAGGGNVAGGNALSNAGGIAQATSWTLGSSAGANTLTATAAGLAGSPVTFNATAFAGNATMIALNGGNSQTDTAGATLPVPYSVLVTDAVGNPVPNVPVAWAVGSGGGSILPATSNTDVNGIASATRTLGTTAGTQTATAAVGGLAGSPITFSATATAATATQIALNAGDGQTATVNTAVATAPSVIVRDQFNNVKSGVAVTFAVTGGGGGVTGAAPATNASGMATVGSWTLGTAAGTNNNTLTATAAGLAGSPVGFTASATAAAATQIALSAGDNQTATVNSAVAVDPAVVVRDPFNNPVQGVVVTFAVTGGGGSVGGATPATDASGIATLGSWTLGTTAGSSNNTLTATAAGLAGSPVPFTASASAGAATQIAVSVGNNQSAQVNTAVPIAPSVFVSDAFGNAVAGVSVTFAVASGGGAVDPTTALITDAAGIAQVTSWTLGAVVGPNTLTATSAPALSGSPVTFTANSFSGSATQMALSAGDAQTDTVGATLPVLYAVIVRDGSNNPVPGIPVSWAVPGGQGSITPASSNTDVNGIATASRTLGTTAGPQTATASVGGLTGSPVNFSATATAGAATQIAVSAGDGQTATVGTAVAVDPSVIVRDQFGNPKAGVSVTFAVSGGAGTVDPVTPLLTDASGLATVTSWTLGNTAGANTLMATSAGLTGSPVTFSATGTAGPATQMTLNAGDNQSATVNTAVAIDPSVLVRDQFNNPVQGVAITFAVGLGGGNVSGGNATTDAGGLATVTAWTLGTSAGAGNNTLTATNGALAGSPITFTASATAGAAQTIALSAGDGQSATVNTAVAIDPVVVVTDQFGNPVAGVNVLFAVQNGGGTVDPVDPTPVATNAAGIATATSWTVGTLAGTNNNTLTASAGVPVGSPVTFTASATPGAAQTIVLQAGDIQTATVNSAVATPPAVLVRDQFNNPVPGFSVTFTITAGGGTLDPVSGGAVLTDAFGLAAVSSWTLGTTAGMLNNTVEATAALTGSPVVFQATAEAGAPATLAISAGNGQSATVNTAVAIDPAVLVTDAFGNPVPNVLVTFAPDPGDGSVTGSPATSDANGIASVTSWTLGTQAGPDSLTASSGALTPLRFGATGTADVAAQIAVSAGNGQSATVNTAVATDPAVLVTDQFGNPVAGHSVTFAVTSGGGLVDPMTALLTNASGIATVTSWTLGTTAGSNSLTATPSPALAGGPVVFTASGTAGAATQMSLNAGNGQSATVNTAVAVDPSVLVRDAFNNPVQGFSVTFTITGGGGTLSPASPASIPTDVNGIATVTSWTLGTTAGANSLAATAALSGSPGNFTATGTPGAVSASQSLVSDSAASIVACNVSCTVAGGTADSVRVIARDAFNNVISGLGVTISSSGSNNIFSPAASGTTDVNGLYTARLSSQTAQAKTISAVINGVPITQTAAVTVNPGPPSTTFSSLVESTDPITACQTSCSLGITASALTVTARDQFNNAIAGASVTVSVTSGTSNYLGAVLRNSISGTTNSLGQYVVNYNSPLAQAKSFNAAITSGSLINETTSLTVNEAAANNVTINLGNSQLARVGLAVATDPSVLVTDAFGNAVSGQTVVFSIAEGGGVVSGGSPITNASGIATVTSWTMGSTGTEGAEGSGTFAGQFENRLKARIGGVDSVEFLAHSFYTFSGDVNPIIGTAVGNQCDGCHYVSWTRANIVGINQQDPAGYNSCTLANSADPLVDAGNASLSLIYLKITTASASICGDQMPPPSGGLTSTQFKIVRSWINDGANNN